MKNNQLDSLRDQAHVNASAAHQAAEDAREFALWVSQTDSERDQSRSLPWLAAHVAKMDSMAEAAK